LSSLAQCAALMIEKTLVRAPSSAALHFFIHANLRQIAGYYEKLVDYKENINSPQISSEKWSYDSKTRLLLKLNAREKTLHADEKFEDFETHFRIKWW
jgi:hypothetical protein